MCEFVYCNCLLSERGGGGEGGKPLFLGLHTYIHTHTAAIIRLGSQPAKRLARLSHSSPASASASVYLDIIRLAALQSTLPLPPDT